MEVSRDNGQRIALESLADWNHIKTVFAETSRAKLEKQIKAEGLQGERDALMAHMNQVSVSLVSPRSRVIYASSAVDRANICYGRTESSHQWAKL